MPAPLTRGGVVHDRTETVAPDYGPDCPRYLLETPAVVAHARLVVVGGESHRLHEEIITAGGVLREGRFARLNVGEAEQLLVAATDTMPHTPLQQRLLELWDRITPSLTQALEVRMRDRTASVQRRLAERADKEAQDMTAILRELQRAIERELVDPVSPQLSLFSNPEREQFERNRDFLRARANAHPRGDRPRDGGDPGPLCRPAAPDVPGGRDVPGPCTAGKGVTPCPLSVTIANGCSSCRTRARS